MVDKLKEWLDKTGYPLEISGESVLVKNQFNVINSHLYDDQEKSISRELDLLASRTWRKNEDELTLDVVLLIECKKSDKPFILLRSQSIDRKNISMGEYYGTDGPYIRFLLNNPNTTIEIPEPHSGCFKLIQGFTNSDETIHKATNTLLKSFNDWIKKEEEYIKLYIESNHHSVALPVLLIDAPLYEAKLDENGEVELNKVSSGVLEHKSKLSNFYPEPFPIPIIPICEFEEFLASIKTYGNQTIKFLADNPLTNMKNYDITEFRLVPIGDAKESNK